MPTHNSHRNIYAEYFALSQYLMGSVYLKESNYMDLFHNNHALAMAGRENAKFLADNTIFGVRMQCAAPYAMKIAQTRTI